MPDNQIPQSQLDKLLAYVMDQRTDNVRELLARNGYAQAQSLTKDQLSTAFLKALKDSETFRSDVSAYLTGLVQEISTSNLSFVGQPERTTMSMVGQPGENNLNAEGNKSPHGSKKLSATGYLNEVGDAGAGWSADASGKITTNAAPPTTAGGSGFFKTLGSLVNKDTLTSLFNTGLTAVSTKLQSNAAKSSEQNALELERIRLQQIQAQATLAAQGGGTKSGLSTGAIVGIAIGGVALLGTIIYLATKKK